MGLTEKETSTETIISSNKEISDFPQKRRPAPPQQKPETIKIKLPETFEGKILGAEIKRVEQFYADGKERTKLFSNPEITDVFIKVMNKIGFRSPEPSNNVIEGLYLSFTSALLRKHESVNSPSGEVAQSDFKESDDLFIGAVEQIIANADNSERFKTRTYNGITEPASQVSKNFHFMNEFNRMYKPEAKQRR